MKHPSLPTEGASGATRRTLSDASCPGTQRKAQGRDFVSRRDKNSEKVGRRASASQFDNVPRCQAPYCWEPSDYKIPKGSTPRTTNGDLYLCVDCLEAQLDRLSTSILLKGEPCEWELTLLALVNVYDGSKDYQQNVLRERCQHRACRRARDESAVVARASGVSA